MKMIVTPVLYHLDHHHVEEQLPLYIGVDLGRQTHRWQSRGDEEEVAPVRFIHIV